MFPRPAGLCGRVLVQWQQQQQRVFGWDSRTRSSFRAMVFPCPAGPCGCVFVQWQQQQQQQQPISCKFSVRF